jgi:probable HAF family extracellular repeat protein
MISKVTRQRPLTLAAAALTTVVLATSQRAETASRQGPSTEASITRSGKHDVGLEAHGFVRDAGGKFITIDAPRAGVFTVVFSVDDNGKTVGGYVDQRGRLHGFLRDRRTFKTIDFPGAGATLVTRMNGRGQIVGAYSDHPNEAALALTHGFLLDDGTFTKIDVPGARRTQPFGINIHGQIVGEYDDGEGRSHGFLLADGVFATIDAPDGGVTRAADIDDSGQILGSSGGRASGPVGVPVSTGFLRGTDGTFTPIAVPDSAQTIPLGFNNSGQVVGRFTPVAGSPGAFLLDAGVYTTIDVPEATGGSILFDISDGGRLAGAFDLVRHGYFQDRRGMFTTVDLPDSVSIQETGGMNNGGQVVGSYLDAAGTLRGFLLDKKRVTTIEVSGALLTVALNINDQGQVVGFYSTDGTVTHGFLLEQGVVTDIDVPGAAHTVAHDIDNQGRIVGEYQDAAGTFRGFIRDTAGTFITIDVPGAAGTSVTGLNDRGQMVGVYADASGIIHAFLKDQSVVTTLDVPGAVVTLPGGINNAGRIVGVYDNGGALEGFMWDNGTFTTPAIAPGTLSGSFPVDIDDRGRIFGTYF